MLETKMTEMLANQVRRIKPIQAGADCKDEQERWRREHEHDQERNYRAEEQAILQEALLKEAEKTIQLESPFNLEQLLKPTAKEQEYIEKYGKPSIRKPAPLTPVNKPKLFTGGWLQTFRNLRARLWPRRRPDDWMAKPVKTCRDIAKHTQLAARKSGGTIVTVDEGGYVYSKPSKLIDITIDDSAYFSKAVEKRDAHIKQSGRTPGLSVKEETKYVISVRNANRQHRRELLACKFSVSKIKNGMLTITVTDRYAVKPLADKLKQMGLVNKYSTS